ncbi:MAG: hypothetical protein WBC44_07015 [Planctomycetaceae bacterium]
MSDREHFWAAYIRTALTPPMTIAEAADVFGLNRNIMVRVIRDMPGVKQVGTFWQLPVNRMPAPWVAEYAARIRHDPHGERLAP